EPFLAHDSGVGDQERILVFGTPKNFERLSTAKAWFMDGTFKVTPSLFYQVYTVHGLYHGAVIPLAYALLPNKQEVTYRRLFSVLSSLLSSVAVEAIYCDFEAAVITTCSRIFPQAKIQGCFFHLCQSVYRRLCKLGFQARYGNDEEFAMRMLPALAFLPPAEVPDAFDGLLEVFPTEATDLAMYFEDTYIGRRRRNGVQAAMFSTSLWSVHDAVLQNLPRTNNSVEAWHRGFQSNVDCCLPNLWAFFKCLKDEQALQELKMAQLDVGQQPPRLARKYREVNERISRILEDHTSSSAVDTLRNIARNIRFSV
ncbi:unnamed protein product, partial [Ixodes pacificus]